MTQDDRTGTSGMGQADAFATIFAGLDRLGPGRAETSARMLRAVAPFLPAAPRIADMGCGTGAGAVDLALSLPQAQVTAIDALPAMAAACRDRARRAGLGRQVTTFVGDMCGTGLATLGVAELDLIWAESSIYAAGRATALASWRKLLRPGGWILFSDVVWLASPEERPPAAVAFWEQAYPDMVQPGQVILEIAAAGLQPVTQHMLARADWQAYYAPLPARLDDLRASAAEGSALGEAIAGLDLELQVFRDSFGSYTSGFFAARRPPGDREGGDRDEGEREGGEREGDPARDQPAKGSATSGQ